MTILTPTPERLAPWQSVQTGDTLGWEPLSGPVYTDMGALIDGWQRIYRSDNEYVLHIPRESYQVITNTQMYALRDAILENGGVVDSMGEVNEGRKVFCIMHLDEPFTVAGDSTLVFPYFVIVNTFDGSGALQVLPMMKRMSCMNMLPLAINRAKQADIYIKFKHTAGATIKIEAAKDLLKNVRQLSQGWERSMNELMQLKVDLSDTQWFVTKFIPLPPDINSMTDRQANSIQSNRNLLEYTIKNSATLEGVRDTAYGLYQAGVEYLDHLRVVRGGVDGLLNRTVLKVDPGKYRAYQLAHEAAH